MIFIYLFLFVFAASYVYLKSTELFLPQEKQESFKQSLIEIESHITTKGANWTVLSPLYYVSSFLDKYLGEQLVSRRSVYLTSLATGILIITTIWLINIATNKGDFLEHSPIHIWNQGIETMNKMHPKEILSKNSTTITSDPEVKKYILKMEQRRSWFIRLNDSGGAYIFAFILLLFCIVVIIALSSLTLAITRQILREMIHAKGIVTLAGGAIVNFFLAMLLASFFGLLLFFVCSPSFWVSWESIVIVFTMKMTWSLIVYIVVAILAAFILPGWIKLVILLSLAPIILLMFSLSLSAIMFLFRKPIHLSLVALLRRALEWKAGPIAFLAALDGLLAFIFTWIYKCLT